MMKQILDLAVKADAKQCLAAIEMFQGRLREIVADEIDALGLPQDERADAKERFITGVFEATDERWRQATAHLPSAKESCRKCGVYRIHHRLSGGMPFHDFVSEGAELQAGLEEALERDQSPD